MTARGNRRRSPDDALHREAPSACVPAPDGSCSVCGDEGLEGLVLEILPDHRARVRLPDGAARDVATDLVDPVRRGERLVVHLGFAIAKIREDAA